MSEVADASVPPAAARRAAATPLMTGALRIFDLSLGEMLWSRRTIFMALVVGSPVILAMVARLVQSTGIAPLRINGTRADAAAIFGMMVWVFFLRFVVPVLGVFYGTSLIADEVDEKTITYLFTRPIRRGSVLIGKYLAYLMCTGMVVLPSIVLVYVLLVPFGEMAGSFRWLLVDLGLLALGLAAYGALFALVGAALKKPLVIGLVFAFGWEQFAMAMPGYLGRFTVAYYLQALVPHAMPSDGVLNVLQSVFSTSPSVGISLLGLGLIISVCLGLATAAVERKEYVLEQ